MSERVDRARRALNRRIIERDAHREHVKRRRLTLSIAIRSLEDAEKAVVAAAIKLDREQENAKNE